jgi:hypothetical protein
MYISKSGFSTRSYYCFSRSKLYGFIHFYHGTILESTWILLQCKADSDTSIKVILIENALALRKKKKNILYIKINFAQSTFTYVLCIKSKVLNIPRLVERFAIDHLHECILLITFCVPPTVAM